MTTERHSGPCRQCPIQHTLQFRAGGDPIHTLGLHAVELYTAPISHLCLRLQTHRLVDHEGELDLDVEIEYMLDLVAHADNVRVSPHYLHVRNACPQLLSVGYTRARQAEQPRARIRGNHQ